MSAPVQRPARSWKWPRASRGTAPAADDRAAGDVACRNCGAEAPGAYCPSCGQETALELPRAGQFMREAAGRYVALDGRMGRTLFALLFRPGFLTREYLAGRRKRYVRPARLVLVLAIVLFAATLEVFWRQRALFTFTLLAATVAFVAGCVMWAGGRAVSARATCDSSAVGSRRTVGPLIGGSPW